MTDVVSQLEAVIAGICDRIDHTLECRQHAVALDMQGETPDCQCKRTARVRSEIARTVERMVKHAIDSTFTSCAVLGVSASDNTITKAWAAAFRSTQEQETKT